MLPTISSTLLSILPHTFCIARPDDYCNTTNIHAGMQRWEILSQGVSSNERVKVLLKELERLSQGDLGTAEYFEGQVC